ncbi:MAG: hypothetical protein M3R45_12570 [Pseudomonadota bacterium]|nr:hypothetical protein [Pseudomonadota bacterium]
MKKFSEQGVPQFAQHHPVLTLENFLGLDDGLTFSRRAKKKPSRMTWLFQFLSDYFRLLSFSFPHLGSRNFNASLKHFAGEIG